MGFRVSSWVPVLVSAAAMAAAMPPARADEAYLCGPDKVVYVKASELEAKKHSDPCIAGYYGLTAGKPEAPATTIAAIVAEPSPAAAPEGPAVMSVEFKPLAGADVPVRAARKDRHAALLAAPVAAPGTDYRNVRVINAASEDAQWFRHAR